MKKIITLFLVSSFCFIAVAFAKEEKSNIVIIWGDDVGQSSISAYIKGLMAEKLVAPSN